MIYERYKVIDKASSLYGRIGEATIIEHPDGMRVLRFRKKGQPRPTPSGYTHGFYPNQLQRHDRTNQDSEDTG